MALHHRCTGSDKTGYSAVRVNLTGPAGVQTCANCGVTKTPLWRHDKATGQAFCNACGIYYKTHGRARPIRLQKGALPAAPPAGAAKKASALLRLIRPLPALPVAQHACKNLAPWSPCTTEHHCACCLFAQYLGKHTQGGHRSRVDEVCEPLLECTSPQSHLLVCARRWPASPPASSAVAARTLPRRTWGCSLRASPRV